MSSTDRPAAASASSRRPGRRAAHLATAGALTLAVAASGGLVWQSSNAAYSARTANPTTSWATGTVVLTDDDTGSALFAVGDVKPGQDGSRCITVTSTGSLPSDVRLYGLGLHSTNGLGDHLGLRISIGQGGGFADCTGFTETDVVYDGPLSSFTTSSYSAGRSLWRTSGTPAGSAQGEQRTYRFSYVLDAAAPDSTQGSLASVEFVWEAQND